MWSEGCVALQCCIYCTLETGVLGLRIHRWVHLKCKCWWGPVRGVRDTPLAQFRQRGQGHGGKEKKIDISSAESHSSWQMVDLMIRNDISVCRNIWNFISVFYCHRFWLIMKMRLKWMLNTAVSFMHHWDRKTHHVTHPHCGHYAHKISMEKKIPSIFNLEMKLKVISPWKYLK